LSNIVIITGTRPEIIKMSPIIKKLRKNDLVFIHSGQHYDYQMSLQFIEELELPKPDYQLRLTSREATTQTSEMISKLHKLFHIIKPDVVCIQGDTNTVLAGGICAIKNKIPIAHIESGLRSKDWRMPEEHNRIVVDHISDLLYAPTKLAKQNLMRESVHGKIFVTGNTSIDAVENNIHRAIHISKLKLPSEFIFTTFHRAENVDNKTVLSSLINAIKSSEIPVVFPIHPRTQYNLKKFNLYSELQNHNNICILPPVGYLESLNLIKKCKFIITDSGGIQEEATSPSIKKFVIVTRKTSDRPESVKSGFAKVVGLETIDIIKEIKNQSKKSKMKIISKHPYGKGNASEKICSSLYSFIK